MARRLLALDADVLGAPAATVFGRDDLRPLAELASARPVARPAGALTGARRGRAATAGSRCRPAGRAQHEITLVRDGHERHLLAATTTLGGDGGALESVLVVDDVTPLVRAQKVAAWRDVARRLAHEIKNPLTPIQLSAERLKRHFADAPEPTRRLVDECARAIVAEVESLKSLVDEFSQFARMPAPQAVPTDLQRAARPTPWRSTPACSRTRRSSCGGARVCRPSASIPSRCGASSSTSSTTPSRR